MSAAEVIKELVMPVVMISANGLICLALYNRLAAITARLRLFYRERFDVDLRLEAISGEAAPSTTKARLLQRKTSLRVQCQLVMRRARRVRNALILLLLSTVGMLVIMLLLGLTHEVAYAAALAVSVFVISVVGMIGGVACAISELMLYLEPIEAEAQDFLLSSTTTPAEGNPSNACERCSFCDQTGRSSLVGPDSTLVQTPG